MTIWNDYKQGRYAKHTFSPRSWRVYANIGDKTSYLVPTENEAMRLIDRFPTSEDVNRYLAEDTKSFDYKMLSLLGCKTGIKLYQQKGTL